METVENSTQYVMSFTLGAYGDMGYIRYFYFVVVTALYSIIIFANALLIGVICVERSLHEPMYVFLCSLLVNELYGSIALFPSLMVNLLSNTHNISFACCIVQIFGLYTYAMIEYCNLAAMAYDRYMSICYPLRYRNIMSSSRIGGLIAVAWLYPFVHLSVVLYLTVRLKFCRKIIDKVYCDNYLLVKLACADTTVNNIYGLFGTTVFVSSIMSLTLFSYIKILRICLISSRETKQKSINTCTPHLVALLSFSIGCCFEVFQSRVTISHHSSGVRIVSSLLFLMFPPLLNPIIYGVKITKIRHVCINVLYLGNI